MAASPRTRSARRISRRSSAGFANLARHVENIRKFGVPAVVAINHFATDTRGRDRADPRLLPRPSRRRGGALPALGRGRRRRRGPGRARSPRWPTAARPTSRRSIPTRMPLAEKLRDHRARDLRRRRHRRSTPRSRRALRRARGGRLRPPAGLRGQDAVFLLGRPDAARRADGPHRCRCARSGSRPAPASSSRSAGTS